MGKPTVGRGIQLPEFADPVPLPAAHGRPNFYGRNFVSQVVGQSPTANLGAVELEAMQAQRFGSGEAVRAWREAMKSFAQELQNGLRPSRGVIAAGVARHPVRALLLRAGTEVNGGQSVESTAGDAELIGSLRSFQPALSKGFEHIPDEGRRVTADELLVVFRTGSIPARTAPAASLFVGLRYAQASSKTGGGMGLSCFANYTTCPALLAPRHNNHTLPKTSPRFFAMSASRKSFVDSAQTDNSFQIAFQQ